MQLGSCCGRVGSCCRGSAAAAGGGRQLLHGGRQLLQGGRQLLQGGRQLLRQVRVPHADVEAIRHHTGYLKHIKVPHAAGRRAGRQAHRTYTNNIISLFSISTGAQPVEQLALFQGRMCQLHRLLVLDDIGDNRTCHRTTTLT